MSTPTEPPSASSPAARDASTRVMVGDGAAPPVAADRREDVGETRKPGSQIGRFVVLEILGTGGMGVVYLAYDPELDRRVAVKLVRTHRDRSDSGSAAGAQARLVREAQSLALLHHPNVVAVYDVGTLGDEVFIAMEYVQGQTLHQWLDAAPRDWRAVLGVMTCAGDGIAAAHRRGLVHRDIKPANILVESDGGSARVVDFGLARARSDDSLPSSEGNASASHRWQQPLTLDGTVMGTPAYMAPEQHSGEAVGPAADQFGFCVTLYEALYGRRPLVGTTAAELAHAAFSGRLLPPPRATAVPRWVHRALVRGLAVNPGDRHPDMDALVTALRADPSPARRRWFGGAAASAAAATAAIVGYRAWAEAPSPCDPGLRVGAIWDEARRERVATAFATVDRPYAAASAARVTTLVDAWAARFSAQWRDACEATSVRREQSDAVLALRNDCLDRRASELDALLDVFESPDPAVVADAVRATRDLGDPTMCADVEALGAGTPLPDDPQTRARLDELRGRIDRARALSAAGHPVEGLAIAEPAAADAASLGHLPTEAEAMLVLGELEIANGSPVTAVARLERAVWAAEAGRADDLAARAWLAIVGLAGPELARFEDAHRASVRADAAIARAGDDPRHRGSYHHVLGLIAGDQGEYALGRDHFERALAIRTEVLDPDDPDLAGTEMGLGGLLMDLGDNPGARAHFARALEIFESGLGPDHPDVGLAMGNLAGVDSVEGRREESEAGYRATLELWERALGPDHPDVALCLNNLANVEADDGRNDQALAHYQRALEIWERALGPDNPRVASALGNIGLLLREMGRTDESRAAHDRELAIVQGLYGTQHAAVAKAWTNLATLASVEGRLDDALAKHHRALAIRQSLADVDPGSVAFSRAGIGVVLRKLRRSAEALVEFEQAHAIWEQQFGADHPLVAQARLDIGRSLTDLGRAREAIEHLEYAHRRRIEIHDPAPMRGETAFALARALWDTGDRERALALGREADALYADAGPADAQARAELTAWLTRGADGR